MNLTCYICTECAWLTYFQSLSYAPFLCIFTEFVLLTVFQSVSFCNISPIYVHISFMSGWPIFNLWAMPYFYSCTEFVQLTSFQSVSYSLSPDAVVFIPRQFPGDGPLQVQQIPTYMTNCYPFVQLDAERSDIISFLNLVRI